MTIRDSEVIHVGNGDVAAVLGLENLSSMVLRIQAKQLLTEADGKAGFDFEEVLLEPKGFASAVVRLDLQSTADNPRVLLRWDSLPTGSHGHLEFPLELNGMCPERAGSQQESVLEHFFYSISHFCTPLLMKSYPRFPVDHGAKSEDDAEHRRK